MPFDKLRGKLPTRRPVCSTTREESEYLRAKLKAAKRLCSSPLRPKDLPSNLEVRELLLSRTLLFECASQGETLRKMRLTALRLMRLPRAVPPALDRQCPHGPCAPRLGYRHPSFLGHARSHHGGTRCECDPLHDRAQAGAQNGSMRVYQHIHARERIPRRVHRPTRPIKPHVAMISSLTHKKIERASAGGTRAIARCGTSRQPLDQQTLEAEARIDRFQMYELLLLPLEEFSKTRAITPRACALSLTPGLSACPATRHHTRRVFARGAAARCRQGH